MTASNAFKLYLISPPQIDLVPFSKTLEEALATGKIDVFQLRLKNTNDNIILENGEALIKICRKYNVPFILNDRLDLALKLQANGVHLGGEDGDIKKAREISPEGFVIGASCYDSKDRIMLAADAGADYVSMGAFFETKTKKSTGKPTLDLLKWCDDFINVQNVCIGGINNNNHKDLIENGANFIAVISYIWNHEQGVTYAINSFYNDI